MEIEKCIYRRKVSDFGSNRKSLFPQKFSLKDSQFTYIMNFFDLKTVNEVN